VHQNIRSVIVWKHWLNQEEVPLIANWGFDWPIESSSRSVGLCVWCSDIVTGDVRRGGKGGGNTLSGNCGGNWRPLVDSRFGRVASITSKSIKLPELAFFNPKKYKSHVTVEPTVWTLNTNENVLFTIALLPLCFILNSCVRHIPSKSDVYVHFHQLVRFWKNMLYIRARVGIYS